VASRLIGLNPWRGWEAGVRPDTTHFIRVEKPGLGRIPEDAQFGEADAGLISEWL
jgi:hypothetical protein